MDVTLEGFPGCAINRLTLLGNVAVWIAIAARMDVAMDVTYARTAVAAIARIVAIADNAMSQVLEVVFTALGKSLC